MANRAKALRRIESVQKQIVRLAEVRLAAANRVCRQLEADKASLTTYVETEEALGVPLAKTALKSLHLLEGRRLAAERTGKAGEMALAAAKQREKVIEGVREKADMAACRAEEDRTLSEVTEAWLAASHASLR